MSIPKAANLFAVCKNLLKRLIPGNNATQGGIEVMHVFDVPDAATSDIDIVVEDKWEVVDVKCIKRGGAGAGNTMQIKKAAAVISDAIACATDNAVTRAASIDDAAGVNVFAAGETLRLTATRAAGTRTCTVIVYGILRA